MLNLAHDNHELAFFTLIIELFIYVPLNNDDKVLYNEKKEKYF